MNQETFFEKFALFADAPDALAKMRELVLELAATGRLCCGESSEWKDGELGDVIELISGQHLLANEHNEQRRGIPYLTGPSDFGEKHPIPTRWTEQPKVVAQPGDILITVKGSGVGKTNVLAEQPTAISRQLMAIRVLGADSDFVHVVVKRAAEHFQNAKTGIAIPGIGRREVLGLKLVLPPLAEQKRIVAKVDELMALCDRLEAQLQERETRQAALACASLARFAAAPTPANLNYIFHPSYTIPPADLRKTILTLAVQGKLVPQDPNDEPALELFARVTAEKRRLVLSREIKSEPLSIPISRDEVFSIPDTWMWVRACDLSRPISSGSTPDQRFFHPSEGIPYLKVYNIRNQIVDFDYKSQFIKVEHHEVKMKRSKLFPGDVIMNIVGPPLGKVAIVPNTFPEWNCNQAIAFFRPIFSELSAFIYTFLKEGSFLNNIQLIGTAGQDNISVTKCKFIPIPLPPLAEQNRIVAKVNQLMALVESLEQQLAAARSTGARLLDAIVQELTSAGARFEPQNGNMKKVKPKARLQMQLFQSSQK